MSKITTLDQFKNIKRLGTNIQVSSLLLGEGAYSNVYLVMRKED